MELRISKNSLVFILLNILIITPMWAMLHQNCNIYITFIALFQMLLSVFLMRRIGIPIFSLQVLFVIISTIFHFGEAYLLAIGRDDLFIYNNIDLATNMATYNKGNIFALLVQAFVVFGIFIANRNSINKEININRDVKIKEYELKRVYLIGIILFLIGVIPNFFYYYLQIKTILHGGTYSGVRNLGLHGSVFLLALFYRTGIYMMLIGSKNNLKRARLFLILAVMLELFFMLSGNRSQELIMIISLFFIYYKVISKVKISRIFIFLIFSYLGAGVLYFVSTYRNANLLDPTLLKSRLLDSLGGNGVYGLLAQLGSNLNVVVLSLVSIPSYHQFNFGFTYIVSWLSIIPDARGILGNIPNRYSFLNYLNTNLPLGGSYIGELYFNFGWLGIIFAIFIGWFIGSVGKKIEQSINGGYWLKFSIYMILFSQLLWWVRDYFSTWIYPFVWSTIAIYIINNYLVDKYHKKNNYSLLYKKKSGGKNVY